MAKHNHQEQQDPAPAKARAHANRAATRPPRHAAQKRPDAADAELAWRLGRVGCMGTARIQGFGRGSGSYWRFLGSLLQVADESLFEGFRFSLLDQFGGRLPAQAPLPACIMDMIGAALASFIK